MTLEGRLPRALTTNTGRCEVLKPNMESDGGMGRVECSMLNGGKLHPIQEHSSELCRQGAKIRSKPLVCWHRKQDGCW